MSGWQIFVAITAGQFALMAVLIGATSRCGYRTRLAVTYGSGLLAAILGVIVATWWESGRG
jgi:hypothetical protein